MSSAVSRIDIVCITKSWYQTTDNLCSKNWNFQHLGLKSTIYDHECNWYLNFQVLARFMVMLNFVVPIFSILFIQTGNSSSLNVCLGKGYQNLFSTQAQLCTQESPYKYCLCWVWITILALVNSKFQINTWQNFQKIWIFQQLNITIASYHNFEFGEGFDDIMKWQTLFIWNSLAMSNIIDAYCVYCCAQEVKNHTEETKAMTSKKAYINRKRWYLLQTPKKHLLNIGTWP